MLIKVYDYRFVASEVAVFYYTGDKLVVHLKDKDCYFVGGPKTIFGQFEEQYRKYLSSDITKTQPTQYKI